MDSLEDDVRRTSPHGAAEAVYLIFYMGFVLESLLCPDAHGRPTGVAVGWLLPACLAVTAYLARAVERGYRFDEDMFGRPRRRPHSSKERKSTTPAEKDQGLASELADTLRSDLDRFLFSWNESESHGGDRK